MQKKDKIEAAIVGVLVVILIAAVSAALKKKPSVTVVPIGLNAGGSPQGTKNAPQDLFNKLDEESKSIELRRDPFTLAPISTTPTSSDKEALSLTGIVWDKENPVAIINGRIVKVGNTVSGNTVLAINPSNVILSDGNRTIELKLK